VDPKVYNVVVLHPKRRKLAMRDLHTAACDFEEKSPDLRRQRLLFRCWHRGTQESDLILGPFAETSLNGFGSSQLDRLEALLDCTDPDLFDWILGGFTPPPEHNHDVMQMLRDFSVRPHRGRQHGGQSSI
jgi:antitoxin CptB